MILTWEADLVDERPSEGLRWRSVPGADLENEGSVTFRAAPGGRGTEVQIELRYEPPLGIVGLSLGKLFGEIPRQTLLNDLRRFKQILETGEVVHSDASIHSGPHAARPAKNSTRQVKS